MSTLETELIHQLCTINAEFEAMGLPQDYRYVGSGLPPGMVSHVFYRGWMIAQYNSLKQIQANIVNLNKKRMELNGEASKAEFNVLSEKITALSMKARSLDTQCQRFMEDNIPVNEECINQRRFELSEQRSNLLIALRSHQVERVALLAAGERGDELLDWRNCKKRLCD